MNLEARNDDSHCIALFNDGDYFGAISKSDLIWLGYREPVYKSPREIALSYFEGYFNKMGQKTLRKYSRPMNLSKFDSQGWMTSPSGVLYIVQDVANSRHSDLFDRSRNGRIGVVSRKIYWAKG